MKKVLTLINDKVEFASYVTEVGKHAEIEHLDIDDMCIRTEDTIYLFAIVEVEVKFGALHNKLNFNEFDVIDCTRFTENLSAIATHTAKLIQAARATDTQQKGTMDANN